MNLRQLGILGLISTSTFGPVWADDSSMMTTTNTAIVSNTVAAAPETNMATVLATNTTNATNVSTAAPTNAVMAPAPPRTAIAPIPPAPAEPAVAAAPIAKSRPAYRPFTVGVEAGTLGAGVDGHWRFANHFGAGAGFDYLPFNYNGTIEGNNYRTKLKLISEPLTLDWFPAKKGSFHVSGGVLLNQNHFTGNATNPNLNGTVDAGATANLDIKQMPVDPYVTNGGNWYFTRSHHLALGGELAWPTPAIRACI